MFPKAILRILLLLPISGCLHAEPWQDWNPRFGLMEDPGLAGNAGPFIEDSDGISRLHGFLATWGRERFQLCGANTLDSYDQVVEDRFYFAAMDLIFLQCVSMNDTKTQQAALAAHDQGTAVEEIRQLIAHQSAVLNATFDALSRVPATNSSADAEVLGWIMKRAIWSRMSFEGVMPSAQAYMTQPNRFEVDGIYLNLMLPTDEGAIDRAFVEAYPWSVTVCSDEHAKAILDGALSRLAEVTRKAKALVPPDEPIDLGSNYGRLVLDYAPALNESQRHDWWQASLIYATLIDLSDAYWNHRYDPELPTPEQAYNLTTQRLAQGRSLVTDDQVFKLQQAILYRFSGHEDAWTNEPFWATLSVALLEMEAYPNAQATGCLA